jgi:hypothetical protein
MNAFETAQSMGLLGTDSEIVATLKNSGLTVSRITIADLLFTLNNRGMLVRLIRPTDTGEKWAGSVVNMVLALNATGDPADALAVNQWFSHITNDRNQFFDTTVPAFAGPFWALSQSMAGLVGMPTAADFQAIADLGGGWRFADLTVEQYTAQRSAAEINDYLDAVINATSEAAREAARATGATLASIKAATVAAVESVV